jgi:hypothetical protein
MSRPSNPIYIAKEAQNMARNAGSRDGHVFQRVATVSMCMVAVLSGMQILMEIWRQLNRDDERRGRGR